MALWDARKCGYLTGRKILYRNCRRKALCGGLLIGPDERGLAFFPSQPVKAASDATDGDQAVDQAIFTRQGEEYDAEQDSKESLTRQKEHGYTGEDKNSPQAIAHDEYEEGARGKGSCALSSFPVFQKMIGSEKGDQKRNEQQTEDEGEKRDPCQPAQHIFQQR